MTDNLSCIHLVLTVCKVAAFFRKDFLIISVVHFFDNAFN